MKTSPGTGAIVGTVQLDPTYRVTDWYSTPIRGSLVFAYDELLVTETNGVIEVADWIQKRHQEGLASAAGWPLHSSELWLLSPSSQCSPTQTLIGTFFVNPDDQPAQGTHSLLESQNWRSASYSGPWSDPTSWQRDLAQELGVHEHIVRTIAIAEAVNNELVYSTRMHEADSKRLLDLTRAAASRIGQS